MLHSIEQKLPYKQLSHNRITKAQTAILHSPAALGNPGSQRRKRHRSFLRRYRDRWLHRQKTNSKNGSESFKKPSQRPAPTARLSPATPIAAIKSTEGLPLLQPVVDDLLDISTRPEYRSNRSDGRIGIRNLRG
jgi:hypothetical protein